MKFKIKEVFDFFSAMFFIILLSPLMLLISIIILFEGPVFIFQPRLGKNGKVFNCLKFRSMIVNADNYIDSHGRPTINRVTKFGSFLRRYSLDELPQLFNILKGQMSFVGPRPALVSHLERYTKEQKTRLNMKPGITGLAQINGRNNIPWSKRIEFDLEYISKFSLWLDIKILIKTAFIIFKTEDFILDRNPETADDLGKSINNE